LYEERNTLSSEQREQIAREIARMKAIVREVKETLGLRSSVQDAARKIWASSALFVETLQETESRALRRYGETPPGLGEYLDPRLATLIAHLSNVTRIAGRGHAEQPFPPVAIEKKE